MGLHTRQRFGKHEIIRQIASLTGELYSRYAGSGVTPHYLLILRDLVFKDPASPGEECPANSFPNPEFSACEECPADTICDLRLEVIRMGNKGAAAFHQPCPKYHSRGAGQDSCSIAPFQAQWCPPFAAYSNIASPPPESMRLAAAQTCVFYDNFADPSRRNFPPSEPGGAEGGGGCAANFYKAEGEIFCRIFHRGYFDPNSLATNTLPADKQFECPLGFYCHLTEDGSTKKACPNGSVGSAPGKSSAIVGCKVNQKGFYFDPNIGENVECPLHHTCPNNSNEPVPCPPGFYYPFTNGKETCLYCVGIYCPESGKGN